MDWFLGWFYDLLYLLQKSVCYLIDFIMQIFYRLGGIETVTVQGEESELLTHFLQSSSVRNAFLAILLIGTILLFVFTIISIVKSEGVEGQQKRTKSHIMKMASRSFLIFLLIPFLVFVGILLCNTVMGAIHMSMNQYAVSGATQSCVGGQILVTSGYDAFRAGDYDREMIERMFVTGELSYLDLGTVKTYYDLSSMNFFVGIIGSLVILVMFAVSTVIFVQRIFDIVLLYIVSPVSVSTIPLDDGNRFRIWKDMLISKMLGAYGIILAMNLYFLIVPQVSGIMFFENGFQNGIVQMLFVLGGAFAVTKANMVISQLTGNSAGGQEAQQMLASINSGIHMTKSAGHLVSGAVGMALGGSDFLSNRRKGVSFSDNVSMVLRGKRNRREVTDTEPTENTKTDYLKQASRLATLPAGVLKDLIQGGTLTAGRNFTARVKNITKGKGYLNHAEFEKKILEKAQTQKQNDAEDKK